MIADDVSSIAARETIDDVFCGAVRAVAVRVIVVGWVVARVVILPRVTVVVPVRAYFDASVFDIAVRVVAVGRPDAERVVVLLV